MGRRGVYRDTVGKPEERDHLEDPGVNGNVTVKLIFMLQDVGAIDCIK
jgi:hypothetical protein